MKLGTVRTVDEQGRVRLEDALEPGKRVSRLECGPEVKVFGGGSDGGDGDSDVH